MRHAAKDTYGAHYLLGGNQYDTVTQGLDVNTIRMVPMCFLSEDYLALFDREFGKILDERETRGSSSPTTTSGSP